MIRSTAFARFIVGVALAAAVGSAPARGDPFIPSLSVTASGPSTLADRASNVEYRFEVANNTGHDLILDFALAAA